MWREPKRVMFFMPSGHFLEDDDDVLTLSTLTYSLAKAAALAVSHVIGGFLSAIDTSLTAINKWITH